MKRALPSVGPHGGGTVARVSVARICTPAVLALVQSSAFLLVYGRALGGTTTPVAPHLTLIGLLVGASYGHAFVLAKLEPTWLRRVVLAGFSLITYGALAVFYGVALVCLYGFRDLPTLGMVQGYLGQLPALVQALPLDRAALLLLAGAAAVALVGMSFALGWCLEGLCPLGLSLVTRKPLRLAIRRALQLGAPTAFIGLLVVPSGWFLNSLEPLTRSIQDQPLLVSRVIVQANEVGSSWDHRLESLYPGNPAGNRRNVVLIYVDALRADVLQPYGGSVRNMPFISALVKRGVVRQYPRAFAACSFTLCGLGALLQSRPAHRISPDNFSLPRLLKKQGYDLRYLLSGDHQNFLNLKSYYGQGIDFYRDGKDIDPQESTNDIVVFEQLSQLPSAQTVGKPQFLFLGLQSVHSLGKRNPAFRRFLPDKLTTMDFANLAQNSVEAYRNNYHNGVLQADSVLEQIWNWLQTNGYLENSVVVITSDHGESLGEHGILGHARSLRIPELLIPLWIYEPSGHLPSRDFVFQTDIAPTVLDLLGLPVPASWEGSSLLRESLESRWCPIYLMNARSQFGLIRYQQGRVTKYLLDTLLGRESVYDLGADPLETDDLVERTSLQTLTEFRLELRRAFGTLLPN